MTNLLHKQEGLLCEIQEALVFVADLRIKTHQIQDLVRDRSIMMNLLQVAKINLTLFHKNIRANALEDQNQHLILTKNSCKDPARIWISIKVGQALPKTAILSFLQNPLFHRDFELQSIILKCGSPLLT